MNIQNASTQNRGATLLISVLMVSVVLAVGFGIYQRTYKSLIFASFLKQSQIAFASADSGLECAMYVDLHLSDTVTAINCFDGVSVEKDTWPARVDDTAPAVSRSFEWLTSSGGCVKVNVEKPSPALYTYSDPDTDTLVTANYSTRIEARGYNDVCGSANPRRVERGLYVDY